MGAGGGGFSSPPQREEEVELGLLFVSTAGTTWAEPVSAVVPVLVLLTDLVRVGAAVQGVLVCVRV